MALNPGEHQVSLSAIQHGAGALDLDHTHMRSLEPYDLYDHH